MGSSDTQFDPTEASPFRVTTGDDGKTIIYDIQARDTAWVDSDAAVDLHDVA